MGQDYDSVVKVLKAYPALSAALVNLGVFVLGYLGMHITASQLVVYVGVANVLLGLVVHSNVMPLVKVSNALQELDEANKAQAENIVTNHGGGYVPESYAPHGNSWKVPAGPDDTQMFPAQKDPHGER
jgi:hypothetical protein